jgi:hypothetical protein
VSDVVVLVLGDRCFEVLRKDGHEVDYCDADGVANRGDLRDMQEEGYVAGLASKVTKANGEVLHFLLGADRRVTSIFLDGIVIPPVRGRRYAGHDA